MQSLILSNFTLKNVIVIIIITITINVVVDFVRLQFPSREALAIETKPLSVSGRVWRRLHTRTHTHASKRQPAHSPTRPRAYSPTLPHTHARTDRWTDGRMDARTDGRTDGRTHGRTDRRTEIKREGPVYVCSHCLASVER